MFLLPSSYAAADQIVPVLAMETGADMGLRDDVTRGDSPPRSPESLSV